MAAARWTMFQLRKAIMISWLSMRRKSPCPPLIKAEIQNSTVKNTQEPKRDYELDFNIPKGNFNEVNIVVFDSEKIGKDKSLGKVNIDIVELANFNESEGRWYSLTGVKSGKILLSADFLEMAGQETALIKGDSPQTNLSLLFREDCQREKYVSIL